MAKGKNENLFCKKVLNVWKNDIYDVFKEIEQMKSVK